MDIEYQKKLIDAIHEDDTEFVVFQFEKCTWITIPECEEIAKQTMKDGGWYPDEAERKLTKLGTQISFVIRDGAAFSFDVLT